MRRILLVLSVALVMAAMVVATAMPAVARQSGKIDGGPPTHNYGASGHSVSLSHCEPAGLGETGAYVSTSSGHTNDNCR